MRYRAVTDTEQALNDAAPTLPATPQTIENILGEVFSRDRDGLADLQVLDGFREEFTLENVVEIVRLIPVTYPEPIVSHWTVLQKEKMDRALQHDPLFLAWEDSEWEAFLGDVFRDYDDDP